MNLFHQVSFEFNDMLFVVFVSIFVSENSSLVRKFHTLSENSGMPENSGVKPENSCIGFDT